MEAGSIKTDRNSLQKIPVRIVQTQDMHGNKKVGVLLDIQYYQSTANIDPDAKVKEFKELYFRIIEQANKILRTTKSKGTNRNSKYYWKLSDLLRHFNEQTQNEFEITNYAAALQRDFGLTDSYVGLILNFSKYFKEDEVLDEIPFNVYLELTRKKGKLDRLGLFEQEKFKLLMMATEEGKIPNGMAYRKALAETIRSHHDKRK
jgi:hypothetical protein